MPLAVRDGDASEDTLDAVRRISFVTTLHIVPCSIPSIERMLQPVRTRLFLPATVHTSIAREPSVLT